MGIPVDMLRAALRDTTARGSLAELISDAAMLVLARLADAEPGVSAEMRALLFERAPSRPPVPTFQAMANAATQAAHGDPVEARATLRRLIDNSPLLVHSANREDTVGALTCVLIDEALDMRLLVVREDGAIVPNEEQHG